VLLLNTPQARRVEPMITFTASRRSALCSALLLLASAGAAQAERFQPLPVESRQTVSSQYAPVPTQDPGVQQPVIPSSVQWELYSQLQQMQEELQRLRGLLEEQAYQIEQINRQQRERYIDLDQRITRLTTEAGGASRASNQPVLASGASSSGIDEKATYDQAINLMRERKFVESIESLEKLLTAHPQGEFAGNAQYWLGELYMALTPSQLDAAKAHFVRMLSQFPSHAKVPDALYKLGMIYQQEGEAQRAQVTLRKLIDEYPNHPTSRLAEEAMSALR
jgi:tol-pal system protein YbgF